MAVVRPYLNIFHGNIGSIMKPNLKAPVLGVIYGNR
ncbi:MAG: hypothetical protein RL380_686, partial [Verrucomicrobiota bacterium]